MRTTFRTSGRPLRVDMSIRKAPFDTDDRRLSLVREGAAPVFGYRSWNDLRPALSPSRRGRP